MARALAVFAALLAFAVTFVGASSASEETTFKGSLEGTVTVTPINPPIASVLIEATGNATKLGRFTVEVPHVVDQAARTGAGSYIFTAANGDTLTASFTGVGTLVAPGVLSTTETATITGGTGRFAGATGSFTSHRTFFITAGETVGSFEGTISSPSRG